MKFYVSVIACLLLLSFSTAAKEGYWVYPPLSILGEKAIQDSNLQNLSITAINLSEDMSSLSTKNDETFVFVYDYSDTNELTTPLVSTKLVFDKDSLSHNVSIPQKKNLILFFIEEDSFRTIIQIEPVIRVYFKELMKAKSYEAIRKYLGEDDLLGVKLITPKTSNFTLSGANSLDKYEYQFVLK